MMPASLPADRGRPYAHAFSLYWSAGWRGVIPVRGKYPPPENYTGATGLWPSYADCFTWADDNTYAAQNIALRLPPSIIGLDVDNYDGKQGAATLFDCQMRWGELPPTYRSTSRDDGISGIRLFTIPSGLSWPGQLPGGGVELIRWDHRYSVVWPSVHPKTLGIYRWVAPRGEVLLNAVPDPEQLPELPSLWVSGLSRGSWQAESKADLDISFTAFIMGFHGAEDSPCPFLAYLGQQTIAALLSSRHDQVRDNVLNLIRRGEEGHPGIVHVLRSVSDAFVMTVTADKTRSVNTAVGEFGRIVDGALRIVGNKPRTPSIGDPCVVPSDPPYRPGEPLDARGRRITPASTRSTPLGDLGAAGQASGPTALDPLVAERLRWRRADRQALRLLDDEERPPIVPDGAIDMTQFLGQEMTPVEYRIQGLMPAGSRVLLAAQYKAGKTTMVCNLVRSLCDGSPFLGFDVNLEDDHRVGLIDFEMDPNQLRRWLQAMRIRNLDRGRIWPLLGRVRQFDLRNEKIFEHWATTLREMNLTTLIVDCLKPILDTMDLDERSDTGKITTPLTALKDAAGIRDLVLVHHMGHNGERSRGDSALRGWPEVEWHVVRLAADVEKDPEPDAPRYFKAFGRDVDIKESRLDYDSETRYLTIGGQETRSERRAKNDDHQLDAMIMQLVTEQPGILRGDVPKALRDQGLSAKRNALIVAAIDRLVTAQLLRVKLGGRTNRAHALFTHSAESFQSFPIVPE